MIESEFYGRDVLWCGMENLQSWEAGTIIRKEVLTVVVVIKLASGLYLMWNEAGKAYADRSITSYF